MVTGGEDARSSFGDRFANENPLSVKGLASIAVNVTPPQTSGSGPSSDAKLNYAWGWFQYHASQRLTAFNFFLVLIGLLFVTFAQAVNHEWRGVGVAIGALGALVSCGFWALDVRNEELILCGLNALEELEDGAGLLIVPREEERNNLPDAIGKSPCGTGWLSKWTGGGRGGSLFRHRTWLRLIMTAVGVMFLAGMVWAGLGFPGASRADEAKQARESPKVSRIHIEVGGAIINSTR